MSSARSYSGGVKAAARILLPEFRSLGKGETFNIQLTSFPYSDHATVSAATAYVVLACVTAGEDCNLGFWRPCDGDASAMHDDVISSCSALSGPRHHGQRYLIHDNIVRKNLGRGMTAFWWRKLVVTSQTRSRQISGSSPCRIASAHWRTRGAPLSRALFRGGSSPQ